MGLSKVEVNLRRLLEAAPRQQNQAKLVHYVTTARGLLEQLGAESTPEGLSSVSKAKPSGYSEMIEALAATLFAPPENEKLADEIRGESCQGDLIESTITLSSELRRRSTAHFEIEPNSHDRKQSYVGTPIKLDADAQTRVERQRELQEDLTDEMVELAHQLKESSLVMNQSVQETGKILDCTERAVEHSLASTSRSTAHASEVYSRHSRTGCVQWLLIIMMACMFVMVVLLIRVT